MRLGGHSDKGLIRGCRVVMFSDKGLRNEALGASRIDQGISITVVINLDVDDRVPESGRITGGR